MLAQAESARTEAVLDAHTKLRLACTDAYLVAKADQENTRNGLEESITSAKACVEQLDASVKQCASDQRRLEVGPRWTGMECTGNINRTE